MGEGLGQGLDAGGDFAARAGRVAQDKARGPAPLPVPGEGVELDAQLKGAFAPSFTPLDRSGDVFSWDPI